MTTLAAILVVVGAGIVFLAAEILDDTFIAGLMFRRWRRVAPTWMRRSIIALCFGVLLVLAGLVLLRTGG